MHGQAKACHIQHLHQVKQYAILEQSVEQGLSPHFEAQLWRPVCYSSVARNDALPSLVRLEQPPSDTMPAIRCCPDRFMITEMMPSQEVMMRHAHRNVGLLVGVDPHIQLPAKPVLTAAYLADSGP